MPSIKLVLTTIISFISQTTITTRMLLLLHLGCSRLPERRFSLHLHLTATTKYSWPTLFIWARPVWKCYDKRKTLITGIVVTTTIGESCPFSSTYLLTDWFYQASESRRYLETREYSNCYHVSSSLIVTHSGPKVTTQSILKMSRKG